MGSFSHNRRSRMTRHESAGNGIRLGFLVSLLAGCSGHGGYGSMNPAPTASVSQPAQPVSINYGQAVTVAWSSAYTTGCTATASSTAGGDVTAIQSTSGSQSVVPTAPGTYTYTLNCTGSGGMTSAMSAQVTVKQSILAALAAGGSVTTIGSTVDPVSGDGNPYGLAIAPVTAGLLTAGDLVVCNFNDSATNTQGLGTSIVGLHPTAGSAPYRIAQSPALQGCNALTVLPDDSISAAAFQSNENPLVSAAGAVGSPFSSDTFAGPWGEAYVAATASQPAAIYVSNISGTIDRIALNADAQSTFTEIVTGFCGSGSPGALFGPAGLTYDVSIDTLYVVDTSSASVVALKGVSGIGADGVTVNGQCSTVSGPPTPALTFSGPSAASARAIAHGSPLITPLSAALLSDGDLVVGNADILITGSQTPNLLIEVSPMLPGGFVGQP